MKNSHVIPLCLLSGLLGGALSSVIQVRAVSVAAANPAQHLTAQSISLVDPAGKLRAQLAFSKEGPPGLFFLDEQGKTRGSMGMYPDGTSYLVFNDKNQNATHVIRSYGPSEAPLLIFKNKAQDQMIMGLNPSGLEPFVMYYDPKRQRKLDFGKYDGP